MLQVLLAHLGSIFQPELLTALPAAASAAAYGHSASGRRLQQQQQRRLPGLAASVGPLPASGSKQDWQAFVAALPDADAPEVFGLPANIERAMAMANSRQLLAALQQMGAAQVRGCSIVERVHLHVGLVTDIGGTSLLN
jgi:hypothetical protein